MFIAQEINDFTHWNVNESHSSDHINQVLMINQLINEID